MIEFSNSCGYTLYLKYFYIILDFKNFYLIKIILSWEIFVFEKEIKKPGNLIRKKSLINYVSRKLEVYRKKKIFDEILN